MESGTMDYTDQIRRQYAKYLIMFPASPKLSAEKVADRTKKANTPELWRMHPVHEAFEFNAEAGQVRRTVNPGRLQSGLAGEYFMVKVGANLRVPRAAFILLGVEPRPSPNHTADHITRLFKYDDAISNVRWSTKRGQVLNRDMPPRKDAFTYQSSLSASFDVLVDENIDALTAQQKYGGTILSLRQIVTPSRIARGANRWNGLLWRKAPHKTVMDGEIWLNFTVYNGIELKPGSFISNMGRIRNLFGKETTGTLESDHGYLVTNTTTLNGQTLKVYYHIAVCTIFHGTKPTSEHTVDHKNRIKTDNRADNLHWATWGEQNINKQPRTNYFLLTQE
jgi:hypothetical protein